MPKIEGEGWGITPNTVLPTVMAQGELEDVEPNVEGRQPVIGGVEAKRELAIGIVIMVHNCRSMLSMAIEPLAVGGSKLLCKSFSSCSRLAFSWSS
jgi:hypothetical protein